ncbi:PID-CTERM protein-sorting domain-containing protein [Hymenobacter arcticus]
MPASLFSLPRLLLAGALLVGSVATSHAQLPGNGGTTGTPPPPQNPTAVPLDGGASLLLAAGVAYGVKRLRRRRA